MTVTNWFKKNASGILSCFGAGGMILTVVLAIRATPTALEKIKSAQIDKEEILNGDLKGTADRKDTGGIGTPRLSPIETVRLCWKDYRLTAAVGSASLACIFGANVLNRRQQASMASAYAALASAFEGYRAKADMICGPGTDAAIEKALEQQKRDIEDDRPPWDEGQTFYLECCEKPTFFERTMEEVLKAEYELNRYFVLNGEATLNQFMDILGLEHVEGGDVIGWESYIGETWYGYGWIDFNHRYYTTDDGLVVCSIDMPFAPHALIEEQ